MFSLVVPLFNEDKNVEPLIDEISFHLKKFKDYEIILINDASSDKTLKVINNIKNNKKSSFEKDSISFETLLKEAMNYLDQK